MARIPLLILLAPLLLLAQEHSVPISTDGNRLIITVGNNDPQPLQGIHVTVRSAPDWVVFKNTSVALDEISVNGWAEAKFEFRVLATEANQKKEVQFAISDQAGMLLGLRTIMLRTASLPKKTMLFPPYPNPANPGSTIEYALHATSQVKIEIYNMLGQRVRTLVDEEKPVGTLAVTWDGKNDKEIAVSSGMYIVKLLATENGSNRVSQFTTKVMIQK